MAAVILGAGPHKGSHTVVAVDQAEVVLGRLRVRAGAAQAGRLLAWAAARPERTWAAEGARGTGCLPDWQLAAAGERVLGVQPKLGGAGAAAGHRGDELRTTPTTPCRRPSPRCARLPPPRSGPRTTPRC